MSNPRPPTFVCELALRAGRAEMRAVNIRLEVGRQIYNACLDEALRCLHRLCQSPRWSAARALPTQTKAQRQRRARAFRRIREHHRFTDYALQHTAIATFRRSRWMCDHLTTHEVQKVGTRAYLAANRMALAQARRARFKGRGQFDTLEGKSNDTGIRWRTDHIEWNDLVLPALIDPTDPVVAYALKKPVKYVRIVRRRLRGVPRLYCQLVCSGRSYRTAQLRTGRGTVGIDMGPSTIAAVGERAAVLTTLCEPVVRKHRSMRRLQRRLDRQRRANNPAHYLADGRVKPGRKRWTISRRQRQTLDQLADLHRREKTYRKTLHGRLANHILSMGGIIQTEKISGRALQRTFGRSVSVRAPGLFLRILRRKAESAGGQVVSIPAGAAKLSQTCHGCGAVHQKSLRDRVHRCACGITMQRDLYSAFLARCTDADGTLHAGTARKRWPGAEPLLRAAWSQALQPATGRPVPATFGRPPVFWSPSGSLAAEGRANAEARDGNIPGEATAVPLRTPGL